MVTRKLSSVTSGRDSSRAFQPEFVYKRPDTSAPGGASGTTRRRRVEHLIGLKVFQETQINELPGTMGTRGPDESAIGERERDGRAVGGAMEIVRR